MLFSFDDNKIKMARKPGKIKKENLYEKMKDEKEIQEIGQEKIKTETVLVLR